jgi:hypothetical protein
VCPAAEHSTARHSTGARQVSEEGSMPRCAEFIAHTQQYCSTALAKRP